MGIINWMQSRFNGKAERFNCSSSHGNSDVASGIASAVSMISKWSIFHGKMCVFLHFELGAGVQESHKVVYETEKHLNAEQWAQAGFLSIGTLGSDDPPVAGDHRAVQEQDLPDFTVEEVRKLQDALARLLRRAKSKSSARGSAAGEDRPPLDRFLNCPSSLEVDRRVQTKHAEGDGDLSPDTKIVLTKARDLLNNGNGNDIRQKSFKFLLKKMFVCHGGFARPPSFKDPVESRMEKFFRAVIGKKINASPGKGTPAARKYLEDGPKGKKRRGDRRRRCEGEDEEESCRWDRTDSEFIVLEI
ncbi:hypothetical protein QOZ80_3AG0251750 [Eleusine coracana subsp. coracana]|nr:hypothetical protein QOZ80_3AG0251750 [Eleusine coracana subsp. coracana]